MKRFRIFVALLLAALWLPMSSHAVLEMAGLIHEELGHHHHDHHSHGEKSAPHSHEAGDHDAADGLCRISSNQVKAPTPSKDVLCWTILPLIELTVEVVSCDPCFGRSPPGQAPLEFSQQWQFSLRTALPVRAPSLVS